MRDFFLRLMASVQVSCSARLDVDLWSRVSCS